MSKKVRAIVAVCCFALTPVYLFCMLLLYSHLANIYQRPDNVFVNLTGLAGFFGTTALLVIGIINAIKAKRD